MATRTRFSLLDLFVATPVKSTLLAVGPLALAAGQFVNSYVNDFSPLLALGFAAVMVGFSFVAMGHHAAEHRLYRLERECVFEGGFDRESTPSPGPDSGSGRRSNAEIDVDGDRRTRP